MTAVNFCYWLHGLFELGRRDVRGKLNLDSAQVDTIERHLKLVFAHDIDPSQGDETHQQALSQIHNPNGDVLLRC